MANLHAQITKPVFISYSRADTIFTRKLRADLESLGFALWRDRENMPIGDGWWQSIKEAIDSCDTLVLCMSPDALKSSNVTDEWQYAREIGKRVMPVVAAEVDFAAVPRWMAARDWADFRAGAKEADTAWKRFINQLNSPYTLRKVPYMIDPLPTNYVARPSETEPLIEALVDQRHGAVALTVALRGAGGYGKTTLARAIAQDRRVRGAFDDGILWVTLGEKASEQDLVDKLLDLTVKLTGDRPPITSLAAASDELRKAVGDRFILIVIDDVWLSDHLRPFLLGTKHTAYLITTRNNGVLPAEAVRQSVDAMHPAEALNLLHYKVVKRNELFSIGEADKLRALADRLGRWPLLLILANKILINQIGYGASLNEALDFVAESLTYGGFDELNDPNNPNQRHSAVSATLAVSLRFLNELQAARFQQLAIFPEDVEIPLATLEKLWGTNRLDVQKCCQRYADLSLLLAYNLNRRTIHLHDVVRTYLRDTHKADLAHWNDQLLDSYAVPTITADQKNWAKLPADEPYLWRTLIYHLKDADHEDSVRLLLSDIQWIRAKLTATDIGGLLDDFADASAADETVHLIQSALTLSAHVLAADKNQLDSQLTGRLVTHRNKPPIAALLSQLEPTFQPLNATHMQAGGALIRILTGHSDKVSGALELNTGHLISWAGRTVRLWDTDGTLIQPLNGHKGRVRFVIQLQDLRVLTWADDGYIRLWKADGTLISASTDRIWHVYGVQELRDQRVLFWTEQMIQFWTPERGALNAVPIRENGSDKITGVLELQAGQLLVWTNGGLLQIWSADGALILTMQPHGTEIKGAIQCRDGRILTWSADKTLRVWNAADATYTSLAGLENLPLGIGGVLELNDGRLLAWEEHGRRLRLTDANGTLLRTMTGHTGEVLGASLLSDERLLSWAADGTLRLWAADGLRIRVLPGHAQEVSGAIELHEGRILSWSADHTLRLWDSHAGDGFSSASEVSAQPIKGMLALSSGQLLWWSGTSLRIWEPDGTLYAQLKGHIKDVRNARELEGGELLTWAGDGTLRLWRLDGTPIRTMQTQTEDVAGARKLDNGRFVAWSGDGTIYLWATDGESVRTLEGHTGSILGVWNMEDGRLLSCAADGTLRFWTADGDSLQVLHGHQGSVTGLLRLRNHQLLSWGTDNVLRLWAIDGTLLRTLDGHTGYVWGATELQDGRLLSWADGIQLRLWDSDGVLLNTLDGHTGKVRGAFELADGRLLSWSDDNSLRLWDRDGYPVRAIAGHQDAIKGALRLVDGRLLSWAKDSTLRLWSADGDAITVFNTDAPIVRGLTLTDSQLIAASDEQGRVLLLRLVK